MGRKRKEIPIPSDQFTARDLRDQNPAVSGFVIQSRLGEWMRRDLIHRVGEERGGRVGGKAAYIYARKAT